MKLPAFYVLDCISKNVYDPYGRTFAPFIAPLFLETYGLVDISTRKKMEEMLLTWRKGSPDARELFGVSAQVTIERAIWGGPDSSPVCFGHNLNLNDMLILRTGHRSSTSAVNWPGTKRTRVHPWTSSASTPLQPL
jgi:hypothetical protein